MLAVTRMREPGQRVGLHAMALGLCMSGQGLVMASAILRHVSGGEGPGRLCGTDVYFLSPHIAST